MDRWETNKDLFTEVGRLGDKISFNNVPLVLRSNNVAEALGGKSLVTQGPGVVVCGKFYLLGQR